MNEFNFARYREEVARRLRNHDYEVGGGGVLFPKMGLRFHGHFEAQCGTIKHGFAPWEIGDNIVPDEALLDILDVYFNQGAQHSAFYISIFTGNVTPGANYTAATYPGLATEATTQYQEATRVLWTPDDAADNGIVNDTTPAVFTIAAGGPFTFRGAGFHSDSGKGATTGKLPAAAKFGTAKSNMGEDELLRVKYAVGGSSS
jgi:hypothetical protein